MNDVYKQMGLEGKKALILHHDDLGMLHAHELAYNRIGFPTGSVVMNTMWAPAFAKYTEGDLGVHLALANDWQWPRFRPLTNGPSLCDETGFMWKSLEDAWGNIVLEEAEVELRAQVDAALAIGIDVTHIDTHMGAVLRPDIADFYMRLALEKGIPAFMANQFIEFPLPDAVQEMIVNLMEKSPLPKTCLIGSYEAPIENRAQWYVEILSNLKPGVYHFLHHAACPTEEARDVPDWQVRKADYMALKNSEVRSIIENDYVLLTYRHIRDALYKYKPGIFK